MTPREETRLPRSSARELLSRWLPVVLWAASISTLSTGAFGSADTGSFLLPLLAYLFPYLPPEYLGVLHQAIRKLAHFTEYLVLGLLLYRALRVGSGWNLRTAVHAVVLAGCYAVTDELHQFFVPGRMAAATDCLIDVSGAAAGLGLVAVRSRR